jgi:hypothetical protein
MINYNLFKENTIKFIGVQQFQAFEETSVCINSTTTSKIPDVNLFVTDLMFFHKKEDVPLDTKWFQNWPIMFTEQERDVVQAAFKEHPVLTIIVPIVITHWDGESIDPDAPENQQFTGIKCVVAEITTPENGSNKAQIVRYTSTRVW